MSKIDAHQHFWKFDPIRDSWINEDMKIIQKDFLPIDLEPLLSRHQFDGCVAVQSDQSEKETHFLLQQADQYQFIKGVVGWVDLQSENILERLEYFSQFEKLKGFRHILQGEKQRDLMLQPQFIRGLNILKNYNFTYDVLIFSDQLQYLPDLLEALPEQHFVLDHIAKPDIKNKQIDIWKKKISILDKYDNLYCKVSGMVTEADWNHWDKQDFYLYMDVIVDTFGMDKIMFGSDWPVCLLAAKYDEVVGITMDYFSQFSAEEQALFYGENAIRFYNL